MSVGGGVDFDGNVSDAVVVVVGVVRRRDSRGRSLGLGQQWHTPFCCSQGEVR